MNDLRAVVLLYHSMNIASNDYIGNDHVALAEDLRLVSSLGWTIVPLITVVDAYLNGQHALPEKTLAISFDDGPDFDFHDLPHPTWGLQRSMLGVLQDAIAKLPFLRSAPHATSFVIASPDARKILDQTCMIGQDWWNDAWWPDACGSGSMHIASHSWDHNHASLPVVAQRAQQKGNFFAIDNFADAEAQVAQSVRYIEKRSPNPAAKLFAYPYGEASEYLLSQYFPDPSLNPGVISAFGCQGEPVTASSNRWLLPRYTCGDHWKTPTDLAQLLGDVRA